MKAGTAPACVGIGSYIFASQRHSPLPSSHLMAANLNKYSSLARPPECNFAVQVFNLIRRSSVCSNIVNQLHSCERNITCDKSRCSFPFPCSRTIERVGESAFGFLIHRDSEKEEVGRSRGPKFRCSFISFGSPLSQDLFTEFLFSQPKVTRFDAINAVPFPDKPNFGVAHVCLAPVRTFQSSFSFLLWFLLCEL